MNKFKYIFIYIIQNKNITIKFLYLKLIFFKQKKQFKHFRGYSFEIRRSNIIIKKRKLYKLKYLDQLDIKKVGSLVL